MVVVNIQRTGLNASTEILKGVNELRRRGYKKRGSIKTINRMGHDIQTGLEKTYYVQMVK